MELGGGPNDVIRRARAGERGAFAVLWTTHHPRVLRYLRSRLPADAEDVAQAVWIDVARNINNFRGDEDDFRGWLFTIARRRIIDELRKPRRGREVVAETLPETGNVLPEDDLDWALTLVRRLPPDQCEAVSLRIIGDLDVSEVAAVMGKSEGAVRVLVHRGLLRLRVLLEARAGPKPVTADEVRSMEGV